MGFIIFRVLQKDFVHVCRGILIKFIWRTEDDKRYFTITKYAQFVRFLHDAELPFVECNLGS